MINSIEHGAEVRTKQPIAIGFNSVHEGSGKKDKTTEANGDVTNSEAKTLAFKAKMLAPPDFSKLTGLQIADLNIDYESQYTKLNPKDRFVYQTIKAYKKAMEDYIQNCKDGQVGAITVAFPLDFVYQDLRTLDVSKITEYLMDAPSLFRFTDHFNNDQIRAIVDYIQERTQGSFQSDFGYYESMFSATLLPVAARTSVSFDLNGADLRDSNFFRFAFGRDSSFKGANFVGADLRSARFDSYGTKHANFEDYSTGELPFGLTIESELEDREIGRFEGANFNAAKFDMAHMQALDLRGVSFVGADFRKVNLTHSLLSGANMTAANLEDFVLPASALGGIMTAALNPAQHGLEEYLTAIRTAYKLNDANLSFARVSANFAFLDLTNTNMFGCQPVLENGASNQQWCHLLSVEDAATRSTEFLKQIETNGAVNQKQTDILAGKDLRGADLSNQDFSGFNFQNVDARGTYFKGSNFEDAYISGMKIDEDTDITDAQIDSSIEGKRLITTSQGKDKLSRRVFADMEGAAKRGIVSGASK